MSELRSVRQEESEPFDPDKKWVEIQEFYKNKHADQILHDEYLLSLLVEGGQIDEANVPGIKSNMNDKLEGEEYIPLEQALGSYYRSKKIELPIGFHSHDRNTPNYYSYNRLVENVVECRLEPEEWLNLNGIWEFEFDDEEIGLKKEWFKRSQLNQTILVPFAYQTELSGIHDTSIHEVVWYAKNIKLPKPWAGRNILLHFGAVDYKTSLWINGQEVGHNNGGHIPFSFDITAYLKEGINRLIVRIVDRQDPHQPRGKQSVSGIPQEVDYICTTGIWQTVWLEPVSKFYIEDLKITPHYDEGIFNIRLLLHAPSTKWTIQSTLYYKSKKINETFTTTNRAAPQLKITIPEVHYWSPDSPNLYTITIKLYRDGVLHDSIQTYSGLRKIAVSGNTILLNNQPIYLKMVLDQGYWPKGNMTAPNDEALKKDIILTKKLGFNGARKHQKIEEPRWLYWCDKLGLLVWEEMPSTRSWSAEAEESMLSEWERVVRRDYNHPSIIAWVPINESWGIPGIRHNHPGQFDFLERTVMITRRIDDTRLIIDNDGWEHTDITDICTIHDYSPSSKALLDRYKPMLERGELPPIMWLTDIPLFARASQYHNQPIILSEVGGFLLIPEGIAQEKRDKLYNYYGSFQTPEELYKKYRDLVQGLAQLHFISGFCYTQLTDTFQEINGLLTFDRKPKISIKKISQTNNLL